MSWNSGTNRDFRTRWQFDSIHPGTIGCRREERHVQQRSQIYCDSQWDSVAGAHTRPEPTSADQATTRPSNGAGSTAIHSGTAPPAPRPAPTKQPPDPLTEPDLLRFTMGQRRRRPHPTRADQRRPSNGARSTAIHSGTASPAPTPDQSRPAPTKQPPDPLTEPDLLRFTIGQRRRRPHPTRADQATTRPSNGARSTAIHNGTASPAPTDPTRADQRRPSNHQTLSRSQIYCDSQWGGVAGAHTRP